jgi:ParB-like chromosome segregation protein Spo0J
MNNKAIHAQLEQLRVEVRPVSALKTNPRNPRAHSAKQIQQIAASINEFGFNCPIVVDHNDQILAGHGRAEAAKQLGMEVIPTIRIEHLSDEQMRAFIIADNKLALNSGWDPEILAIELQYLVELDSAFEVEITGFETAEIDRLIDEPSQTQDDPSDFVPPSNRRPYLGSEIVGNLASINCCAEMPATPLAI